PLRAQARRRSGARTCGRYATPPPGCGTRPRARLGLLEQPQPVLDLRHPQLELLELVTRHEPELAKEAGEPRPRPLAQPDGLASPAADGLLDDRPRLVTPHPAARRDLFRQRIRPLGRQR